MRFLFSIFLILVSASVNATSYFVANSGNDANNGTSTGTPWQHISKVNSFSLSPADVVNWNGGDVFNDTTLFVQQGVTFNSYGTGEAMITNSGGAISATNVDGFTLENLQIGTPSNSVNNAIIDMMNSASGTVYKNVTISNCYVTGGNIGCFLETPSVTADCLSNITIVQNIFTNSAALDYYCQDSAFDNNTKKFINTLFSNNVVADVYGVTTPGGSGFGAVFSNCTNGEVCYDYFHDCGFQTGQIGGGPAGAFPINSYGVTVEWCIADKIHTSNGSDGVGLDLDNSTDHCKILHCLIYDCDGSGIIWSGGNCDIEFNYIVDDFQLLSSFDGELRNFGTATGNTIANNTVITTWNVWSGNADGDIVINNILYSSKSDCTRIGFSTIVPTMIANNLFAPNSTISWNAGGYQSIPIQALETGYPMGYCGNPNFANAVVASITDPHQISTLTNYFVGIGSTADKASLPFINVPAIGPQTPAQYLAVTNDNRGVLIRTNFNLGAVDTNWSSGSFSPFNNYNPVMPSLGIVGASPTGAPRNDFSGDVGWTATASANMTITAIGRWMLAGNIQSHTLSVYTGAFPSPTLAQSVSWSPANQTIGQFGYVLLSPPIIVTAGTQITFVDGESNGGDFWYDSQNYTFSSDFTSVSSCFNSSGFSAGTANQSFVPVNIVYTKP